MLIAISGVQGSGKTTVLNKIQSLGFKVIERKTSRSILTDWKTTLDEVYRDPVTAVKFHDEILKRKIEDEREAVISKDLFFTERSYADLFTYAVLTVGSYNAHDTWVNTYFDHCRKMNKQYLGIVQMHGGFKANLNDGVRGFNKHYVELVNRTLSDIIHEMSYNNILIQNEPKIIELADAQGYSLNDFNIVDMRARYIIEQAQQLWLEVRLPRGVVTNAN